MARARRTRLAKNVKKFVKKVLQITHGAEYAAASKKVKKRIKKLVKSVKCVTHVKYANKRCMKKTDKQGKITPVRAEKAMTSKKVSSPSRSLPTNA